MFEFNKYNCVPTGTQKSYITTSNQGQVIELVNIIPITTLASCNIYSLVKGVNHQLKT